MLTRTVKLNGSFDSIISFLKEHSKRNDQMETEGRITIRTKIFIAVLFIVMKKI